MNISYIEDYVKSKAVLLIWPNSNNYNNSIEIQKKFANFAMKLSYSAPIFILVASEEREKANFLIPKHINLININLNINFFNQIQFSFIKYFDINYNIGFVLDKNFNTQLLSDKILNLFKFKNINISNDFDKITFCHNAYSFNGKETLIITSKFLETNNLSEHEIQQKLEKTPITKLIILEQTTVEPLAKFISSDVVIIHTEKRENYLGYLESKNALKKINSYNKNHCFKIIKIPSPELELFDKECDKHPLVSYTSIIILNEIVLMPLINHFKDNDILEMYKNIFYDKDIYGIESLELLKANGSLRDFCLQIPFNTL